MRDSPTIHLSSPRGWLLAFAVAGFAFLAATLVPVQTTTAQGVPAVDIQASTDGISVDFFATTPRNVLTFSVRVVGPHNFVFEQRIEDATLQWIPPDNLADGLYSWEAWVVTADLGAQMRELTPALEARAADHWFDNEVKQTHITSGTFKVENGLLESISNSGNEADGAPITRRIASAILDFLVPPTHAQDVTTSGDFRAGSGLVAGSETENPAQGEVRFVFPAGNNAAIEKFTNTLNFEFPAGTSRMALHSSGNFGIGTTAPADRLHVAGTSFPIRVSSFVATDLFRFNIGGTGLWFLDRDGDSVVRMNHSATSGALVVDGAGIGMGTTAPAAALHVQRADNTAEVRVEDTGALDGQTMFNLINNGHPKFRLQDTSQSSVNWEFRTAGIQGSNERFQINKIGSGAIEMQVQAGGNVTIAGTLTQGSSRAVKERITDLDPEQVLASLNALPVYEWSYQRAPDQRHLGPMAEDFHAVFGLGGNDKHLAPGDLAGVALAAAKALNDRSATLEDRSASLEAETRALQAENVELRSRLERLEALLLANM